MTMDITLTNIITLTLSIAGLIGLLIKLLVMQLQRNIKESFDSQNKRLDRIEQAGREEVGNWQRVERDLSALKADLPAHYVRREDYIRGQSVIESKLDSLAAQLQNTNLTAQIAALKAGKHPGN
jgi:hypothetical protein